MHLMTCNHKRLKIARIHELSDPFDLWAVAQPDRQLRNALRRYKEEMARRFGMLCFSATWRNPLLWSHYADRHRGLALGFDSNEQKIKPVKYVHQRPVLHVVNLQIANELLYTKYMGWSYEQEARVFLSLEDRDPSTGLYFADFGSDCMLKEVIVGPLSSVSQSRLREVLPESSDGVALKKG